MSTQDGATPPAEGGNAAATGYQKRVRGGHRAHLTKVIADITTKLASSTGQEDSLRSARACLERKAVTLSKLDEEILVGLEDAAEMATEIEATENIQNEIQEQIIKIDKVLNHGLLYLHGQTCCFKSQKLRGQKVMGPRNEKYVMCSPLAPHISSCILTESLQ